MDTLVAWIRELWTVGVRLVDPSTALVLVGPLGVAWMSLLLIVSLGHWGLQVSCRARRYTAGAWLCVHFAFWCAAFTSFRHVGTVFQPAIHESAPTDARATLVLLEDANVLRQTAASQPYIVLLTMTATVLFAVLWYALVAPRHGYALAFVLGAAPTPDAWRRTLLLPSQQRTMESLLHLIGWSNVHGLKRIQDARRNLTNSQLKERKALATARTALATTARELADGYRSTQSGGPPRSVHAALRGDWGSGKSVMLRSLQADLHAAGVPDVWFNAWQHQTESLQHALLLDIARELVSHEPRLWKQIPAWHLVASRTVSILGLAISALRMKAVLALRYTPPAVSFREDLERLLEAYWKRHQLPLVLVIDEVDRCEHLVAQRLLPLTQRFLDVPGIAVVMPYVERQLRHKVFHPAMVELKDLRGAVAGLLDPFTSLADERANSNSQAQRDRSWDGIPETGLDGRGWSDEAAREQGFPIPWTPVVRAFHRERERNRDFEQWFYSSAEERYLGQVALEVRPLAREDYVALVRGDPGVQQLVERLLSKPPEGSKPPERVANEAFVEAVADKVWRTAHAQKRKRGPIRPRAVLNATYQSLATTLTAKLETNLDVSGAQLTVFALLLGLSVAGDVAKYAESQSYGSPEVRS